MSLLLLVAGALFAVIFLLNNVFQTLRGNGKIGFGDILFAFLATLVSAAAVLLNYWGDAPDPQLDVWAMGLGGALAALSLILILLEVFRPQRLKGSRGVLGLFSGLLIAASGLLVPFAAAYFALQSDQPTRTPTQVAQADSTAEVTAEATAEVSRGAQLFYAIRDAIRHEIQVDDQVITDALEAGTPLREIVEAYNGDVEVVIDDIAVAMTLWVRDGISIGEIGALQGALLLSQMENIVRLAVNSDINRFADSFGRETPAPGETAGSIFGMVSPQPTNGTPNGATLTAPAATQAATRTPTLTETPRPTRTPTASRTRFEFSTRTLAPTLTPTEVVICQATVTNNLRLRAEANQDAETLLTIPADSILFLSGRTEDSAWWQTEFEGQAGWVVGEFLLLSAACPELPITED